MRLAVLFVHRHSHSSHAAGFSEALMLIVESKQNRVRLAATPSPSPSPSPTVRRASSSKSYVEWPEMERINVLDLKARIVKRVGAEKANRYFSHFRSFISSRLSKPELDKLVVITIGRENVVLHNQLVKAILTNAVKAKVPPLPLPPAQHASKPTAKPYSPCITSDDSIPHASPSPLSNGDSFLSSPRRGRSAVLRNRDREHKASPLGPREDHPTPDFSRPVQQLDGAAKQLDAESNSSHEPPAKRARVLHPTSDDSVSAVESGILGGEESTLPKDERDEILPPLPFGSSIRAPLGVPFHFESMDAGRRRPVFHAFPAHLLLSDGPGEDFVNAGDLPDGDTMCRRMEQVAAAEGLEGVSRESADVLNYALDAYLSRLIKSCVDAVGSRAGLDRGRPDHRGAVWDKNVKEVAFSGMKLHQRMNGIWTGPVAELLKKGEEKMQPLISLTDFKVAMDINPQQLGEDWPLHLEKISFRIFDQ